MELSKLDRYIVPSLEDNKKQLAICIANELTNVLYDTRVYDTDQAQFLFDRLVDTLVREQFDQLIRLVPRTSEVLKENK